MTNYDVAVFKLQSIHRVASVLGVAEDFVGTDELLDRIRKQDPEASALLDRFFAVYDEWFELSKTDAMTIDEAFAFTEKIEARDTARKLLIDHLNSRRA
jgi:hypothetical protein